MSNKNKIEFYLEESSIISFQNLVNNIKHSSSRNNKKNIESQISTNDRTPNKGNLDNIKKDINEDNINNDNTFNLKFFPNDDTLSMNQICLSNNISQIKNKSKKYLLIILSFIS